jgi:hypothetical protein
VPDPALDGVDIEGPDPDEPEESKDVTDVAIEYSPPWLVSMVAHAVLLLLLGIFYFSQTRAEIVEVEVVYAETEGEQLIDDSLDMSTMDPMDMQEPEFSKDLNPVENPLAAPPELTINLDANTSTSLLEAPSIGLALTGREKGAKRALLAAYGGTATTEAAVMSGLRWLKKNQNRDGTWSLDGPYSDGAEGIPNKTAATAMALLAFQGNGQTHRSGEFKDNVSRGIAALLRMQNDEGDFFDEEGAPHHHHLYSQAQATIAVCELYGMTKDKKLEEPAQRALNYAAKIQADDGKGGGGWRYYPGDDVDTSVTGWYVMAFQSARMSGLHAPSLVLDKVSKYLDHVTEDGSRYSYRLDEKFKPSMTAEALLCRQYMGWRRNEPRLIAGVKYLNENLVDWELLDVYYWYYATQVTHHMGGDYWDTWNNVMRQVLPENQVKGGKEEGSWDPQGDPYGFQGGRLYVTCFCVYMLEVYYRHLPIYQHAGF